LEAVTREQHTLREALAFEGAGLHTGMPARMRLLPQPAGTGLVFRLDGSVTFPAHAEYIVDTRRATVLGAGGATVSTVEHVLSALCGMQVDNAMIDVTGPEIPAVDGSAAPFADEIARAGVVAQGVPAPRATIPATRVYREGDALLILTPAEKFRVRCSIDFPAPIGAGYFDAELDPVTYRERVASARTFGYLHEVEALIANGLARGGTLDNALVFAPDGPMTPLRMSNEPVAHKVLDLVGDLSLLGAAPCFEAVAIKSGHRLHATATRDLRAAAVSGIAS
jgi:UDP-3-O-[3-hydroxymyristoyl] N-acetylglucosamine deacetylase